ncbi:MAG: hypothetical protein JWO35_848 [Candidatus Saccharibacteria bacterium]|nr:hypothetical protein [Candidatus Saccharibacteria bacterium]
MIMKRAYRQFVYLLSASTLLIATVLLLFAMNQSSDNEYVHQLDGNFSTEFTGLNDIFTKNGFTFTELRKASCRIGTPNSGLEGVHICDTSRNGFLSATAQQLGSWDETSKQIDHYLINRGWEFSKGSRTDITYSELNTMFTASVTGPVIVMYNKQFSGITCKLVLDANREYPHQKPNQIDVSESCERDI